MSVNNKEKNIKRIILPFIEIFSKVFTFLVIILLVRLINIEDFADYAYTLNVVLWAALIMDGGMANLIFNKSVQNDTTNINELYSTRFIVSIGVILSVFTLFFILKRELYIIATLLSISVYFSSTSYLIKMLSRGLGDLKVDITAILTEPTLKLLVLLFLFFFKDLYQYDLIIILIILLIISIISFNYNLFVLSKLFNLKLKLRETVKSFAIFKESFDATKYYLLYILAYVGIARMDIFFLEMHAVKSEVARFSSAFSVYQTGQLFFFAIVTSQFKLLLKNTKVLYSIIFPLILFAILTVYSLAPYLYSILFPAEYSGGENILKPMIFGLIPSIFNFYIITKNNYQNLVRVNFVILLLLFLTKLSIYIVLKPEYGIVNSYVIVGIEILVSSVFLLYFLYQRIRNR